MLNIKIVTKMLCRYKYLGIKDKTEMELNSY